MSSLWNGKVFNSSNLWLICLFEQVKPDQDDYANTEWVGKALAPKRRSPALLDVEAVIALDSGVNINGNPQWWWLDGGAEVVITPLSAAALAMRKKSWSGKVRSVSRSDVDGLAPTIDRTLDVSWGSWFQS